MMTHRIGNSEVKVISGDICESKCEVIVSSDDSRLSQGGGVSHVIDDDLHDFIDGNSVRRCLQLMSVLKYANVL